MQFWSIIILLGVMAMAYHLGRRRSLATVGGRRCRNLHSLPGLLRFYTALWAGLPALLIAGLWVFSRAR